MSSQQKVHGAAAAARRTNQKKGKEAAAAAAAESSSSNVKKAGGEKEEESKKKVQQLPASAKSSEMHAALKQSSQQHQQQQPVKPKKNRKIQFLLSEILALGGDKTDLDLLLPVLSGSELDDDDDEEVEEEEEEEGRGVEAEKRKLEKEKVKAKAKKEAAAALAAASVSAPPTVIDEKALQKDLAAFLLGLNIPKEPHYLDSDEEMEEKEVVAATAIAVPEKEEDPLPATPTLTKAQLKKQKKQLLKKEALELEKQAASTKESAILDLTRITNDFLNEGDVQDNYFNDEDMEAEKAAGRTNNTLLLGREKEGDVREMVGQLLKGVMPSTLNVMDSGDMILELNSTLWYQHELPEIALATVSAQAQDKVNQVYLHAESLWKSDVEKFEKKRASVSRADKDFISTILKNGTVTDKVSALTLLIQDAPIHAFNHLRLHLIQNMARKKSRREAMLAIDSIKDLVLNNLLPPDRKLRYFLDQPCLSRKVTSAHLIMWYFEDALKKAYFEFIQIVEELSKDPLPHVKTKMVSCVYELLCAKPEEEENLLSLLVNKMGDLDKKIASKATHLLSQLLVQHPVMKQVIIAEVERLLLRPNVADRARYYSITFLNQIALTKSGEDVKAANILINLYFTLFSALVKKMKSEAPDRKAPKKKDRTKSKQSQAKNQKEEPELVEMDSLNSKMMAALLSGVNRAFPFSQLESVVFDSHIDTLFVISHLSTFNTSIQALTLIFQVQTSREKLSDRFYRSLYDSLFDRRLYDASKQAMYLNLLYRALKADTSLDRVHAFVKRIVQSGSLSQVPLLCGSLFLVSELCNQRPELRNSATEPEAEKDVERLEGEDVKRYDGRKRDPLFANAKYACLWDLSIFAEHFHPTVALYAKTILSGDSLTVPKDATNYDPLLNHTLSRFLDRFVYKAPKKVKTIHHGSSLMQPREQNNLLISGGRKKINVLLEDEEDETKLKALDDAPVNSSSWKNESQVPADEMFFYKYFKDHKKAPATEVKKAEEEFSDVDSDPEEMKDDEIWRAMTRSSGFDKAGLGGDVDDDIEFEDEDDLDLDLDGSDEGEGMDDNGDDSQDEEEDSDTDMQDEIAMEDWANMDGNKKELSEEEDEGEAGAELNQEEFDDAEESLELDSNEEEEDLSNDDEFIDQDEEFSGLFGGEEGSDFEEEEEETQAKPEKKKPKQLQKISSIASKLGYTGDYFDTKHSMNEFASADDFAALMNAASSQDEDEQENEPSSSKSSSFKRKSNFSRPSNKKKRY